MQWERFTAAVRELVERLDVRLAVGFHGIPMGVPHTRPLGVTAHAHPARARSPVTSPGGPRPGAGQRLGLLELRLGEAGHDAMGFAVHVPHYLAQAEYPAAAVTLLESVSRATGLRCPTTHCASAAERDRRGDRPAGRGLRGDHGGRAGPGASSTTRSPREPSAAICWWTGPEQLPTADETRRPVRAVPGRAAGPGRLLGLLTLLPAILLPLSVLGRPGAWPPGAG